MRKGTIDKLQAAISKDVAYELRPILSELLSRTTSAIHREHFDLLTTVRKHLESAISTEEAQVLNTLVRTAVVDTDNCILEMKAVTDAIHRLQERQAALTANNNNDNDNEM